LDDIYYLSKVYIEENRNSEAMQILKVGEQVIDEGQPFNAEAINIYQCFFTLYRKLPNFERTAFYQQKYIALKDSVYTDELTTNLMKVEAEYLDRESKGRIQVQAQTLLLNEAIIEHQQWLNIFIGSTAIMLIVIIALLARPNREKQKLNDLLDPAC
jgi:hypothetical protein